MFDIGFSELLVIGVVALVVIGPEKLPKVARTVGLLLGRAQRYVSDMKSEINREMELEELRKMQADMKEAAARFHSDMQTTLKDVEASVLEHNNPTQSAMHDQPQPLPALERLPDSEQPPK